MKKCPKCQKTFDDAMRFCQVDGTPLVDDEPVDPYKTMVARPGDIAAAMPPSAPEESPKSEPSIPIAPPGNDMVLDIPEQSDPLKTMYASEDEIRREMAARDVDDPQVIDIPPLAEAPLGPPQPAEPDFSAPAPPPSSPFDTPPPASPFSSGKDDAGFPKTSQPIPSPFSEPKREFAEPDAASRPPKVENPAFVEPAPVGNVPPVNPFDAPPVSAPPAQSSWTPPASAGKADLGQRPEQPQVQNPGTSGPSSVLGIVAVLLGIVGLLIALPAILFPICSTITFLLGIGAVITGILGRSRASKSPAEYGGKGLATGGLILGILDILAPFAIAAFWLLFFGGLSFIGNMAG
jgi:hypothetical protein